MTTLPLSSLLLRVTPQHPLVRILSDPFFSRLALLEYRALSTTHAKYLAALSPALFTPACLTTLHVVALAAVVARTLAQRNLYLSALALAEPISRLLAALHAPPDPQQLKHLLSFSLLLSLFSLAESVTIHPTTSHQQQQQRVSFFSPRSLYQLLSLTPATTPPRTIFPQPRPLNIPPISPLSHSRTPLRPVALPAYYFTTHLRYRLFKLLVLWIGARTDGLGASALWDWIIEPFFIVFSKRTDDGRGKKRIVRVVVEEVDVLPNGKEEPNIPTTRNGSTVVAGRERKRAWMNGSPPREGFGFGETSTALSSEGADDDRTTTIQSESPTIATTTTTHHHRMMPYDSTRETDEYDTLDESFDSSISTSTHQNDEEDNTASPRYYSHSHNVDANKFPTPNHVPYRLTSSSFPLHARTSNPSLSTSAHSHPPQQNGFDSPSPAVPHSSIGGYEIEPIHLPTSTPSSTTRPNHPISSPSKSHTNSASTTTMTTGGSGRKSSIDIKNYLRSVQTEMGTAVANGEDVGVEGWAKGVGGAGGSGGFGGAAW